MRALVRSEVRVDAPARVVWDYVTDWPRQREWIPLTRVEVVPRETGDLARGVGGRFRAWTGIGPVGFWDSITITLWEEGADGSGRCEIIHTGRLVHGDAELRVVPEGPSACTFALWERLEVPGGRVGALLWQLSRWFVGRAADRVLRRMAALAPVLTTAGNDG